MLILSVETSKFNVKFVFDFDFDAKGVRLIKELFSKVSEIILAYCISIIHYGCQSSWHMMILFSFGV